MVVDKLGNLVEITIGRTPSRSDAAMWDKKKEGKNVWLSIADLPVGGRKTVGDSKEYISDKAAARFETVPKGTLLVSFKLTLGRMAFAEKDLRTNEAIAALRNDQEKIIDEYLYYYLTFFNWMDYASSDKKVKGYTLNKAKLNDITVIYPESILKQREVVTKLDAVFEKIDKAQTLLQENIYNTAKLQQSILNEQFKFDADTHIHRLGDVTEVITRGISPKYTDDERHGLVVLNQRCVRGHKIVPEFARYHDVMIKKVSTIKLLSIGDVIINSTGQGTLGRTAYVSKLNGVTTVDSHITIVRPKNIFYPEYFAYLISMYEDSFIEMSTGTSGQTELPRASLEELEINYTESLDAQKKAVAKLNDLLGKTDDINKLFEKKQSKLGELKQSILSQAFSENVVK